MGNPAGCWRVAVGAARGLAKLLFQRPRCRCCCMHAPQANSVPPLTINPACVSSAGQGQSRMEERQACVCWRARREEGSRLAAPGSRTRQTGSVCAEAVHNHFFFATQVQVWKSGGSLRRVPPHSPPPPLTPLPDSGYCPLRWSDRSPYHLALYHCGVIRTLRRTRCQGLDTPLRSAVTGAASQQEHVFYTHCHSHSVETWKLWAPQPACTHAHASDCWRTTSIPWRLLPPAAVLLLWRRRCLLVASIRVGRCRRAATLRRRLLLLPRAMVGLLRLILRWWLSILRLRWWLPILRRLLLLAIGHVGRRLRPRGRRRGVRRVHGVGRVRRPARLAGVHGRAAVVARRQLVLLLLLEVHVRHVLRGLLCRCCCRLGVALLALPPVQLLRT